MFKQGSNLCEAESRVPENGRANVTATPRTVKTRWELGIRRASQSAPGTPGSAAARPPAWRGA